MFFFFQAEDGIRDGHVTGVQTCALPISVGEGAAVGPDTTLIDVRVGERATVVRTHATGAEIGPHAQVGPFAYLRAGSVLRREAKVGTFVETKAAEIGEGAKVPHL